MAISCTSISERPNAVLRSQGANFRVFSQLVYSRLFRLYHALSRGAPDQTLRCLLQIGQSRMLLMQRVRKDYMPCLYAVL